MLISHTLMAVF